MYVCTTYTRLHLSILLCVGSTDVTDKDNDTSLTFQFWRGIIHMIAHSFAHLLESKNLKKKPIKSKFEIKGLVVFYVWLEEDITC